MTIREQYKLAYAEIKISASWDMTTLDQLVAVKEYLYRKNNVSYKVFDSAYLSHIMSSDRDTLGRAHRLSVAIKAIDYLLNITPKSKY